MKLKMKRTGEPFLLEAQNQTGNTVLMDASPEIGGTDRGARPMELLVMGLMGCSSIDVLMILGKQKLAVTQFEVTADAEREKEGDVSLFKNIHLNFRIVGNGTEEQYRRAIDLSLTKYCSVAKTLEKTASISYSLIKD